MKVEVNIQVEVNMEVECKPFEKEIQLGLKSKRNKEIPQRNYESVEEALKTIFSKLSRERQHNHEAKDLQFY